MENIRLFTSESVTEGHPDKVCDRIADAVLDAYLAQDKFSRVALEVCCKGEHMYMLGEITSKGSVDLPAVARRVANLLDAYSLRAESGHTPSYTFRTFADEAYRRRLEHKALAGE